MGESAAGAEPHLPLARPDRDAAARGLEPDEAAAGRGDADGAAAVVAARHGHDARGHGRRRAAAAAARGARRVPGVAAAPEGAGGRHALEGQLGRVGLAEHDQAGGEAAPHVVGMLAGGRQAGQGAAAAGGGQAGVVLGGVLDEQGHAGQRASREAARQLARRALAGLPPAAAHAHYVRRCLAAGLVVFGKTNTPELALKGVTAPRAFGRSSNPWDTTRTPGGSSGGAAAAVAAGVVPLAGGNDGGGSIRIPAACCGLVGLKPSRGRISVGPGEGEVWFGASSEGVISRSVRDTALALDILSGPEPGDPVALPAPGDGLAQRVQAALEAQALLVGLAQAQRQVVVAGAHGGQRLLAFELEGQRVLQAGLGGGVVEAVELGLQAGRRAGHRGDLRLGRLDAALQLAAPGRQGLRRKTGLLGAPLQRAQLLAGIGQLAFGGDGAVFELGMALLGVAELDVQFLEAGLADGAALLQGFLLRGDLGQFGVQRAAALLAGLGLLGQAQQLHVDLVGPGLGLAGLAAQRGEPAAGIVELVLDAGQRDARLVGDEVLGTLGRRELLDLLGATTSLPSIQILFIIRKNHPT